MDLYTGNHFASFDQSAYVSLTTPDFGREPEELAPNKHASTVVRIVYNRVMNAILAHLAGQVGNPPKVVFNARESGEPPIYYLNGYIQNPIVQQLAMQMGGRQDETSGEYIDDTVQQTATIYGAGHANTAKAMTDAGMSVPLQEPLIGQLKTMIDQGQVATMQARQMGMPAPQGIVPPEALVEVTDQSTAQFTQTVYDALWEQCGGVEATNENILNKKVIGWQPTLFESDRSKIDCGECPITLTNIESSQVYYDPMTSSYRPGQYAIMREPVSLEEGIAKYPQFADVLNAKAEAGALSSRLARNGDGGRLGALNFGRDMVVVRTLWIRNWPYPMDPDEALECGAVQMGQVPDEQAQIQGGAAGDQVPANSPTEPGSADVSQGDVPRNPIASGQPSDQPSGDGAAQPVDGNQNQQQVSVDQPAQPAAAPAPPPMRPAFLHSTTGQEVTPQHPDWPIVYAIREIRDIEGIVIFDQRCPLPDFPLPPNINIPVPFSPYGIGEPDRLDGLQMAINRVLSDLVTFHRYNAYPPEMIHESVAAYQGDAFKEVRSQPNDLIVIPRTIADQVGGDLSQCVQFLKMPEMSADAWQLLQFLVDAIDKEANNAEVSQGIAPSGSSGAWVANLQAAAAQITQVTSMSTEAWLKKLVRLFVHFITNDMTVKDIQKYTSKYPPPILAAFHERQKALYLDISVEIQSGSAAAKQAQAQQMIQAKAAGIPVGTPAILRSMNLDPDDQLREEGDFNAKMVQTGAAAAPMQQPQQAQPAGEPAPISQAAA